MKYTIKIKNLNGKVLFEYEKENNTTKDTIEEAVRKGISLEGADLNGADLYEANLVGANLAHANLQRANLNKASLMDANLTDAILHNANLNQAVLSHAKMYGVLAWRAVFSYGVLCNTSFIGANLNSAIFTCCILEGARFCRAQMSYANLYDSNLINSDFSNAILNGADFRDTNLMGAIFKNAILNGANFSTATHVPYVPMYCPSTGSFVGWKKLYDKLIKLEIPESARRSSATSNKCRCDRAKVLAITDINGENPIDKIRNCDWEDNLIYKVGEMVYPDSFDEDRWNECSHGIHFFINKQDAIDY